MGDGPFHQVSSLGFLLLGKKRFTFSVSVQWERMKLSFERNRSADGSGEYSSSPCSVFVKLVQFSFCYLTLELYGMSGKKLCNLNEIVQVHILLKRGVFTRATLSFLLYLLIPSLEWSHIPNTDCYFSIFCHIPCPFMDDSMLLVIEGLACGIKIPLRFDYEESPQKTHMLQVYLPSSTPSASGTIEK